MGVQSLTIDAFEYVNFHGIFKGFQVQVGGKREKKKMKFRKLEQNELGSLGIASGEWDDWVGKGSTRLLDPAFSRASNCIQTQT